MAGTPFPIPKSSTPGARAGEGEGRLFNCYAVTEGDRSYVRRTAGLDTQCNGRAWFSGNAQRRDLLGARGQRQQRDLPLADHPAIPVTLGKAQLTHHKLLKERTNIQRADLELFVGGDG